MIRGEALNEHYGNARHRAPPQQFKSLYEAGLSNLSPQEQIAVVARSQGLNKQYGGGNGNVSCDAAAFHRDGRRLVRLERGRTVRSPSQARCCWRWGLRWSAGGGTITSPASRQDGKRGATSGPHGPLVVRARRIALVTPPFRIGVMQLTMEPLDEMLATARALDEHGFDTIWLAEAYPWWRKHQMEARSSTVVSALMAKETSRLTIGWGIISPFTRHPVQVAMDARVVQELAPGRFILGFGTSKIFLNNARMQTKKTLGPMRDAVAIVRGVLSARVPRTRARRGAPTFPRCTPTRRTTCRPSTSPRPRRRCRRSRARSATAA